PGAPIVTRKGNVRCFGNMLGQQLAACPKSAGGQNNPTPPEDPLLRFPARHRAARLLSERKHRCREIHLDVRFTLNCLEEEVGDGFVSLPRVGSPCAVAKGKLVELELNARLISQAITYD